jgi:hypothetical protein
LVCSFNPLDPLVGAVDRVPTGFHELSEVFFGLLLLPDQGSHPYRRVTDFQHVLFLEFHPGRDLQQRSGRLQAEHVEIGARMGGHFVVWKSRVI